MTLMKVFLGLHNGKIDTHKIDPCCQSRTNKLGGILIKQPDCKSQTTPVLAIYSPSPFEP